MHTHDRRPNQAFLPVAVADLAARLRLRRAGRGWRGDCPLCCYSNALALDVKNERELLWCANCDDREGLARLLRCAGAVPAPLAAADLAAERGWSVFPMTSKKRPLAGSHGVRDATRDPERLREMFARPGAGLVAIATGAASGVSILDIDRQHSGADWWRENRSRMPRTLTWRTRSGGLHVVMLHRPDLRTTPLGAIGQGIEIRSTGASAIYWPASGLPILDASAPAPWPDWLMPPPRPSWTPPPATPWHGSDRRARAYAEAAMRQAIERVAAAGDGRRNTTLNSETYGLLRLAATGAVTPAEVAHAMACAGLAAGLDRREVAATLRSARHARGDVA